MNLQVVVHPIYHSLFHYRAQAYINILINYSSNAIGCPFLKLFFTLLFFFFSHTVDYRCYQAVVEGFPGSGEDES